MLVSSVTVTTVALRLSLLLLPRLPLLLLLLVVLVVVLPPVYDTGHYAELYPGFLLPKPFATVAGILGEFY